MKVINFGRIRTTLSIIVFLMVVFVSVGLIWFQHSGGQLYSVQTGSMEPELTPGGMVMVTPVAPEALRLNDVITYESSENSDVTITHRIIELEQSEQTGRTIITTQGDNNEVADQPISDAQVIGRVDRHIPYAGSFLDFVRHPIGLIVLIYVPALGVFLAEARKLHAYYKSREPYIIPGYAHR